MSKKKKKLRAKKPPDIIESSSANDTTPFIERDIIKGLITSKEYLTAIEAIWNPQYMNNAAGRVAMWCWEHYNLHGNSINKDITKKFYDELKTKRLDADLAKNIENEILPGLSMEHLSKGIRIKTLIKQTIMYFQKRQLEIHNQEIQNLLSRGELIKVQELAESFVGITIEEDDTVELSNQKELDDAIDEVHATNNKILIRFPNRLGKLFNEHFIRGSLISFLGMEKVGKSWWLLEIAIRAARQGKKVAFFQAGDMSRAQQMERIISCISGRASNKKYYGMQWEATKDCIYNQMDDGCPHPKEKQYNASGVFTSDNIEDIRKKTKGELIDAYKINPDYKPCYKCGTSYDNGNKGITWIKQIDIGTPLNKKETKASLKKFFVDHKRNFKLDTHVNDTLTVKKAKAQLELWEKRDNFIADVIIFDYADIIHSTIKEERHKHNKIWKDLKSLSQSKTEPLVITATQADAKSYEKNLLSKGNFSESKTKNAHVNAMWGLNRDTTGREEALGILRINELFLRNGEKTGKVLTVIQNLKRGRPYIKSYF